MKHQGNLSIHLFKNAIVMNYTNHKQFFIQRKRFKDKEDYKFMIGQMLDSLLEQTSLKTYEDLHTYVIAPYHLVKHHTLLTLPNLEKVKGHKKEEALKLYVEQNEKVKVESVNFGFSFQGLNPKDPIEGNFFTFYYIKPEDLEFYLEVLFEKGLNLRWLESEELSIRRYTNRERLTRPEHNSVYIHQFINGKESYVGFLIFVGPLIAAVRYLKEDMFSVPDLMDELHLMIQHTQSHFNGFAVDNYFVFGDDPTFISSFANHFRGSNLRVLETQFIPTYGNLYLGKKTMFGELFKKKGGVM